MIRESASAVSASACRWDLPALRVAPLRVLLTSGRAQGSLSPAVRCTNAIAAAAALSVAGPVPALLDALGEVRGDLCRVGGKRRYSLPACPITEDSPLDAVILHSVVSELVSENRVEVDHVGLGQSVGATRGAGGLEFCGDIVGGGADFGA